MATPKKTSNGKWHIQFMVGACRESGTFDTKSEAAIWAARRSTELRLLGRGKGGEIKTLADAFDRYTKEVSANKKGERWERIRLAAFQTPLHYPLNSNKKLNSINSSDIAAWRDARLLKVNKTSVAREMTLLSSVFEVARKEWLWVDKNPCIDVRKPPKGQHRERIITGQEIRGILRALGYQRRVTSVGCSIAHCFLLALQTGMRAGELCALKWPDISIAGARLHTSKTGAGRTVPLTPAAFKTIERMRGFDGDSIFSVSPQTLDALFRRARTRAGLEGFTFHDSRHTAATRLAQKLHVLDLCKVFGWASTTRALTYYNPNSEDLALRMSR
ncbi:site-specific integrase [Polynucleobacter sp. Fuers-14]|uniref:tyrosine-type recombinase/integrase n=1 Tax=Polynucleobacter sp. Fuers-14 TaxID=1758364 RepID=UPI001C0C12BD|nr:site-specific integrase [Polynucleobacter sp. Fuers-14]MBU3640958.1 site-specific integrase [Polynucleobacter sp. Fuers-14]